MSWPSASLVEGEFTGCQFSNVTLAGSLRVLIHPLQVTQYNNGPPPKRVTIVQTEISRVVRTETDTVTKYQSGPAPKTVTKTITDVSRVVRTETDLVTKYQSGPAPKTVTKVTTKTVSPKKETGPSCLLSPFSIHANASLV